ncbi:hypothetical protein [Parasitella parasitica]|uniref:Peptidase S1 domain-containing protein n=1 Tax=Parasitella parasitica TaxID=35722 RepID=A0A0B7NQV0_9FUNG|nr:hypothetical protein [Parasitella parasitica]
MIRLKNCKSKILPRYYTTSNQSSVGIRRENKSRWERRSALTPSTVKRLIQETGTKVYVQPSTKRIFTNEDYKKAGAIITEDISKADIILGIKEVPESSLLKDKTYLFFSHTHKGNEKNMPMLQNILDKKIRLIDYELMKDETGKRLVAFGQFAGNAGMIDIFHGMGHRFLGLGYSTPFMYTSMAHAYPTIAEAKSALHRMGDVITENGTPKDFGPLVYAFTGSGNVAQGAMEIFKEVPHEFVPAEDLAKLVNDKNPRLGRLYATHLQVKDYIELKDGGGKMIDYEDYLANPERYQSNFHHKIAPYTNCVVTGAYWDKNYPRLMTNKQLADFEKLKKKGLINKGKMMSLADIVCDVKGAFECLSHSTNVEDGFFYYDAIRDIEHKDAEGEGIQIMGIDILPAELPVESSEFFSKALYPYIKEMVQSSPNTPLDKLPPLLRQATIADQGKLTEPHKGLLSSRAATHNNKKTVLLLGSGMVAAPLVEHLAKRPDVNVVVASNMADEANALVRNYTNAESAPLDISDRLELSRLVSKADVVVSLVPAFLHTQVANVCIEQRKDMVTASYVSKEMEQLENKAQKAGILIMNEVGLDPGIDHMSAMKIIDEAHRNGSKIKSFISWCGGLPSPEASNVPLGYKFSWSPRGVLTASGNDAVYWNDAKKHTISGENLLKEHFPVVQTPYAGFVFEGLANRNSLGYADIYGLGDLSQMDTMFRGTLRYQGYSDLLYAFRKLGFLDQERPIAGQCQSWSKYFDFVLSGKSSNLSQDERHQRMVDRLGLPRDHFMIEKTWSAISYFLSANDQEKIHAPNGSALDLFTILLSRRLKYDKGERDMVAMHHEFGVQHRSGKKETLTSTLIKYGNQTHTAMADTVGLPTAMAVDLVLDNKIPERGVQRPTKPHVYLPILDQLEMKGIKFVEKSEPYKFNRLDATGSNSCKMDEMPVINQNRYTVAYGNKNATRQSYAAIRQAIIHPLYVSSQQRQAQVYATAHTDEIPYDIGLIKLTTPLVPNKFINRIPLLVNQTTSMDILETIGMGYTGYQKPQAEILQFAQCNSTNAETLRDNNYNQSIILATSNAGLCHGDSGSPLLVKSSSNVDAEYYLGGILNRILNAYDPDPENGSCPLHESNLTSFINSFVRPSAHLKWITSVTKLPLDALMDPMTSADGTRMFVAPTSSAITDTSFLLRASCFGIDWPIFLLMASLFTFIYF